MNVPAGNRPRSRVLVATDCAFWHEDRGDRARMAALCRHLCRNGFEVAIFFAGTLDAGDRSVLAERFPGLTVHARPAPPASKPSHADETFRTHLKRTLPPGTVRAVQAVEGAIGEAVWRMRRLNRGVLRAIAGTQITLDRAVASEDTVRLAQVIGAAPPDALIVECVHLSGLLDGLSAAQRKALCTIVDTLDVMHTRARRFRQHGKRHWLRIAEEEERAALSRFDAVVAIQQRDAEVFRTMLPATTVLVVMHAPPLASAPLPVYGPVRIVCVATAAPPNVHGMQAFLRQVWRPLYAELKEEVALVIAGEVGSRLRRSHDGVTLLGTVANLAETYANAHVVVNPVHYGGGLKIKCVEGLSHGRPVVTTPVGAEGLEDADGKGLFICTGPGDMRTVLERLVRDPRALESAAHAASSYAATAFSPEAVYAPLVAYLRHGTP